MRRCLAILVLMLMPFQLGWAAVSAYCLHEAEAGASHLGHHAHQHSSETEPAPDGGLAGGDFDCGFCHAAFVPALPGGGASPALFDPTTVFLIDPVSLPPSVQAAEPERPKWARPA